MLLGKKHFCTPVLYMEYGTGTIYLQFHLELQCHKCWMSIAFYLATLTKETGRRTLSKQRKPLWYVFRSVEKIIFRKKSLVFFGQYVSRASTFNFNQLKCVFNVGRGKDAGEETRPIHKAENVTPTCSQSKWCIIFELKVLLRWKFGCDHPPIESKYSTK